MSTRFDANQGLVIVPAEIKGPSGTVLPRLALDTDATGTLINVALLVAIGCDPSAVPDRIQVATGSGVEFVPRLVVSNLSALGQTRRDFRVLAHTLPPSAGIDGLLGLDFLRGSSLTIDFRTGQITIA